MSDGLLRKYAWPLAAAGVALVLLLLRLASLLELGFVADDFAHLVEDRPQPWYFAQDHLYRPLRNATFRVLPALFGLDPVPYRFLVMAGFLTCLVLLFVFLRLQGVGLAGALSACVFAALHPRNQRVLYWFAAAQDIVVACAVLAALSGWSLFRQRASRAGYVLALVSFGVGLGFKEPAIVLPALLVIVDVHRLGADWRAVRTARFWRPYLGLLPVLGLYAAFVLLYPEGRLRQAEAGASIYGVSTLLQSVLALVRTLFNLVLPFAPPLALRDVTVPQLACAVLVLAAVVLLAVWTRTRRAWGAAAAWVLVAAVPTSVFARTNNGDQYLFLPMLGIAFGLAWSFDVLFHSRTWVRAVGCAVLMLQAFFGARYLARAHEEWRVAGELVQRTLQSARAIPSSETLTTLVVVDLPHMNGRAPVLNNGLKGALMSVGFPRSLALEVNHQRPGTDPAQEALVQGLLACPAGPVGPAPRRTFVWVDGALVERTGACAERWVHEDEQRRALAWVKS
ncbi:MAG TPA: hypothetical protein VFZ09_47910 [Archangium sp.]|uniref:hypothetical protein n=1 Tax=Archangium sp. TaxID=1872627 RepID=UPI002E36BB4D|nr:hypothetical protein [Archangium sp.]HEX5754002.1 hypothetical protein [Archangium sp.]